jgi:uncharacterized delta-60 repeat protein/gliding motility-associated-like protein
MKKIILLSILFVFSTQIWAQTATNIGYLDTTFNAAGPIKGAKYMNIGGGGRALAVDNLGRIVMAACSANYSQNIFLLRLKSDGSLDKPFGLTSTDTIAKISLSTTFGISYGHCNSLAIQKDGKFVIGGNNTQLGTMIVIRLNADGSLDNTFDTDGLATINISGGNDIIKDVAIQSTGKIIVSGTSAGKLIVLRLNSDGTRDTGFSTYTSANTVTETVAGLELVNDTIVAGLSYTATSLYYFGVQKLYPNGTVFWNKTLNFSATYAYMEDVAVQTDGKIIMAGSDYSGFRAYRLNPDGSIDNSFAGTGTFLRNPGFGASMKSIVIEKDGKIDFVGYLSGSYVIVRSDLSGLPDNTFGQAGQILINTTHSPNTIKSILSPDQMLLIAGDMYTSAEIIKVQVKPVIHIVGNTYVLPKSIETYKIAVPPSIVVSSYQWAYSGSYFTYIPGSTSYPLTIFFSDTATSGKLTCTLTSGGTIIGKAEMDIVVNTKPSNATQLTKISCTSKLSNCSAGYIDYFRLNALVNKGSGCSDNGYSDYTQSNFTDTLAAGGAYTAAMKVPNDGTASNYIGIWIDYNNDGNFSNLEEFVGEQYSTTTDLNVSIFLKNREGFDGPKRMRVRTRPDVKFTSTESCQINGESGETEDYLIFLLKQPTLEAPEIITPNEDGLNDYFVIRGVDPKTDLSKKLTIFDRIGTTVFTSSDYENDWSGTNKNGNKLDPGTYYYVFKNGKNSLKGFLEIRY